MRAKKPFNPAKEMAFESPEALDLDPTTNDGLSIAIWTKLKEKIETYNARLVIEMTGFFI